MTLAPGCPPAVASEAARRLGAALMARLAGRLRRGIAVAVVPRGQPAGGPGGSSPRPALRGVLGAR